MVTKLNKISRVFEQRLLANNIRGYAVTMEFTDLHEETLTKARFAIGDCKTAAISFQLLMSGEPIKLEEGCAVYVNILRPDKQQLFQSCEILDAELGIVMLKLKVQSMMYKGECTLEVVVIPSAQERLISPKILYTVYDSLEMNNREPDEDEIGIINGMIGEFINLKAELTANEKVRKENEKNRVEAENLREQAEALRQQTFETNEENRKVTFEEAENLRKETFNEAESSRKETFEEAETLRENIFADLEERIIQRLAELEYEIISNEEIDQIFEEVIKDIE